MPIQNIAQMSEEKRAGRVMRVARMYILDANEEIRRLKAKIGRLERAEGGESDEEQDWNGEGGIGGAKGVGDTGESGDVSKEASEDGSATENRDYNPRQRDDKGAADNEEVMDKFWGTEDGDGDVEIMGNDQATIDEIESSGDVDDNSEEFEIMKSSEYYQEQPL